MKKLSKYIYQIGENLIDIRMISGVRQNSLILNSGLFMYINCELTEDDRGLILDLIKERGCIMTSIYDCHFDIRLVGCVSLDEGVSSKQGYRVYSFDWGSRDDKAKQFEDFKKTWLEYNLNKYGV